MPLRRPSSRRVPYPLDTSLYKTLRVLRKQFGKDAEGMTLVVDRSRDNKVPGYYDPNENQIVLSVAAVRAGVGRDPVSKVKTPMLRGRGFESLMQAVLRHEFAHAVQLNRERRTGKSEPPLDRLGARGYGGEPPHGSFFNRLNVSLQGSGSEVDTPHIGVPAELRRLFGRGT